MITFEEIRRAQAALEGITYETPLQEFGYFNDLLGGRVFFKLENLQRVGSFKLRGAYNRLRQLTSFELSKGVIAASAGNHAQGVALAAGLVGTTALIYMPLGASLTKVEATRSYGAEVRLFGESFDESMAEARRVAEETGRVFISAFNDKAVIAGQGTVALEMLEERPTLDVLVVPVGGGGLIAGMALAVKERYPHIKVIGVQAQGAPAFVNSWRQGKISRVSRVKTIADGIAVGEPGNLTFELVKKYVDDLVTVDEQDISRAILLFLERSKLVVEGAGAVGLAALISGKIPIGMGTIGTVVSGGNIDVTLLSRIIDKGLVEEGRQMHFSTVVGDRPGQLSRLLEVIAATQANVIRIEHERWSPRLSATEVSVNIVLETRNLKHTEDILERLANHGYVVRFNA